MSWHGEITIRNFNSTHLSGVVELHKLCFTKENNLSMRLGDRFIRKTYDFFYLDDISFGFVAMADDKIVGVITGRLDYYVDALNKYRKMDLVIGAITHPKVLFNAETLKAGLNIFSSLISGKTRHSLQPLDQAPSHVEGGTATLASIAVHPDFTKNKVSDQLIDASVKYVSQKKKQILRCGISRDNMASRFIFTKKGFVEDKVLSTESDMYYYKKLTS